MNPKKVTFTAVAMAVGLALGGCSSNGNPSGTGSPSPGSSTPTATASTSSGAAALVPAAARAKGTISVATEAQGPPFESVDASGTIVGLDVDLMQAIGAQLGLKVQLNNVGFDTIIPGMSGGRYDIGMSQFSDTLERQKVVDFVTYFNDGTALMVPNGNPAGLDINKLCGKTVGVGKGGVEVDVVLPALSKACTDAGQPAIVVKVFLGGQDAPDLAVASGQVQATLLDSVTAQSISKGSAGKFQVVGAPIDITPFGIAVSKSTGLTEAVHAAMQALIANGEYAKILDKYGLTAGAVTSSAVNAATS